MARTLRGAIIRARKKGRPLAEAVDEHFLQGQNIHADRSVLVIDLYEPQFATLAERAPVGLGGLAGCEKLTGGADLIELIAGARSLIDADANGWTLALAIATSAQTPYMLEPASGKTLPFGEDRIQVIVPTDNAEVGMAALKLGMGLALAIGDPGSEADCEKAIGQRRQFTRIARGQSLDMLTLAIARKALDHDIPVYFPAPSLSIVQLGQGRHARLVGETVIDPQSCQAQHMARNKWAVISRLRAFGLPTLRSGLAINADEAAALARNIGTAVVVKPVAGGKGTGVSLELRAEKQVRDAYAIAAPRKERVLVERYAQGDDIRMLVVAGKLIAAAKRLPATVTGDGASTVRQLIEALNDDPRRGAPYEKLMDRVQVDQRLEALLVQQGLTLESVPAAGAVVKATLAANISQGGTAIDVTDQVHPDNRAMAEHAARLNHALVAGIDFLTPDVGASWRNGPGWILEINTSPGLRPHWIANPAQDVVTPILRVAFAEGAPARVPLAGITGSIGKTTTCQMLAQIARTAGRHPAVNTTQGTWSGDAQITNADSSGGRYVVDLLTDPAVDIAIAELARGGLLKRGLALDWLDVAAVLNIGGNHIGMDGIESREDLARIKSIPVRRARKWVFLLADDPLVLGMREAMHPKAQLGLVSRDPANAALARHRKAGGCTVTLEGTVKKAKKIVVRQGDEVEFELKLAAIPVSAGGLSTAIAENAMFASAIALRLGLDGKDIAAGLKSFVSDKTQNPGRHNHVPGLPFELVLTWVDGNLALDELLIRLDEETCAGRRHLYLAVPGTRSDEWTIEMGRRAAGHFDHYWCVDMDDLRGRAPLESAELIARGLRERGVPESAITCLTGDHRRATYVLAHVEPGEHMTMMVYDTAPVLHDVELFRGELEKA